MLPSYDDFQQNIAFDNSDTFWLIFADYCDENDIGHDIREQINELHLDSWFYEGFGDGVMEGECVGNDVGVMYDAGVGGISGMGVGAGGVVTSLVGGPGFGVGATYGVY